MLHKLILVIEDELAIRKMLKQILSKEDFTVSEAESVTEARQCMADYRPDLIILDWMLPDVSGIEYARELRKDETYKEIPIIMLTAKVSEEERVKGLESGADDYIVKPFSPRELVARIHAVMRRASPIPVESELTAGRIKVNLHAYVVSCDGKKIPLGLTEYKILCFFINNQNRVFSRTQLLDRVWDRGGYIEERTVDVHITRLRKAFSPYGVDKYFKTVRGVGYRFTVVDHAQDT
ncbi:MAG: phosphate regulon transcriptional regulator PhoB [Gammaproteobacteria bacterium]|nr:phosphate regulon transcriptional regulator PhoB [Gammaproteobacteria bacterium]